MGSTAYGSLIIDSELNIVGFNKDMEALCPEIKAGEKCYDVLAKNNKQCAACPVISKDVHYCANTDRCSYSDFTEVSLTPEHRLYMLTFKMDGHSIRVPSDI